MHSYSVTSEIAGYDRKRRVVRVLFEAGFVAAFQILFQAILPDGVKLGRLWYFGFAAIGGLIFALMFETVLFKLIFPYTSWASVNFRPQPEQISFRLPRLRLTHSRRVLPFSSISDW
jgi:hypothetical protein